MTREYLERWARVLGLTPVPWESDESLHGRCRAECAPPMRAADWAYQPAQVAAWIDPAWRARCAAMVDLSDGGAK